MLLHFTPKILCRYRNVELVDLHLEPFDVTLKGGSDLMTCRPYPNKRYAVAWGSYHIAAKSAIFAI